MKTLLKISILLNLGLLGGLFFMVTEKQKAVLPSGPVVVVPETKPSVNPITTGACQIPSRVESKPFRWSQLESTNYHTYIKNLRDIDCPEPTLRAIVVADVDKRYDTKYQQLEQDLTALATNSWSVQLAAYDVQQAIQNQLQKLPSAEAAEIADLLGLPPVQQAMASTVAGAAPVSQISRHPSRATTITMPLIFQDVDPQTLNLNPEQIQAIADLRQNFWNEIGGPNQDASDPAYLERWKKAQPETDNLLRGMIGTSAFQNYQLQAMAGTSTKTTVK